MIKYMHCCYGEPPFSFRTLNSHQMHTFVELHLKVLAVLIDRVIGLLEGSHKQWNLHPGSTQAINHTNVFVVSHAGDRGALPISLPLK